MSVEAQGQAAEGEGVRAVTTTPDAAAGAEAQHDLQDFVENASVPLHCVGPEGTILWANRAELELMGYGRDEYLGRSIADFHVDRAAAERLLARLRNSEALCSHEAALRAKDGSVKHVL